MDLRVGIDLVEVDTVRESILVHGRGYVARMCTDDELRGCAPTGDVDPRRLAERIAGKEAAFKALRPAADDTLAWHSVEVLGERGRHRLRLPGPAADRAAAAGLDTWQVSITAAGGYACAVVTADGGAS
jgi:phosphopantetheine--protein transferase-like protein